MTYATIDKRSQRVSQVGFLHLLKEGLAYQLEAPTLWDVDFRTAVAQAELEDREREGAYHRLNSIVQTAASSRSRLRDQSCCPPAWRSSRTRTMRGTSRSSARRC